MSDYSKGGFIPDPAGTEIILASNECVLRPPRDGRSVCIRVEHPTPTSDCSTIDWIEHVSTIEEEP